MEQLTEEGLKEAIMELDSMITESKKDVEVFTLEREYMMKELVQMKMDVKSPIIIGS